MDKNTIIDVNNTINNDSDFDFYKLLNQAKKISRQKTKHTNKVSEEKKTPQTCLISGEILKDHCITLICNHTFNYDSIYKEVIHQRKPNYKETMRVKYFQIKCPYCRKIQNSILPKIPGYKSIKYVNSPNRLVNYNNMCNYTFRSGKNKGKQCKKQCYFEKCFKHEKICKKKKEEKKKESQNTTNDQNIHTNSTIKCGYIYKRGKNKGLACKCKKVFKIFNSIPLCKTHYKQITAKLL